MERTFNVIRLRENIKLGQRIEALQVEVMRKGKWEKLAEATSIGANRLMRLSEPVTAKELRLTILKSPVSIALSDLGLYLEAERMEPAAGKAANTAAISKGGWKVTSTAGDQPQHIIDDNPATIWSSQSTGAFKPVSIDIDLGFPVEFSAFSYLPRQDKKIDGIADQYSFYVSDDGKTYREVASGEFSNVRANPIEQFVSLKGKLQARYIRFVGKRSLDGKGITVAELGLQK